MNSLPNSWHKVLSQLGFRRRNRAGVKRTSINRPTRLSMESLEDRRVLATLTVNTDLDILNDNDNFLSLREALHAVNNQSSTGVPVSQIDNQPFGSNDTILFDSSLSGKTIELTESTNTLGDTTHQLGITKSVTIDASNLNNWLTIEAYDPDADNTNGNGEGAMVIANTDYADQYTQQPTQIDVRLDGLRFAHADNGLESQKDAGAVTVFTDDEHVANVTISNSLFEHNHSQYNGGAIGVKGQGAGHLVIENTVIRDNHSSGGSGGGVYYAPGNSGIHHSLYSLTVTDSEIYRNRADNESELNGGGGIFFHNPSDLTITRSKITDNNSARHGGGVAVLAIKNAIIHDSDFSRNTAAIDGGGFHILDYSSAESLDIRSSLFSFNEAGSDGAGLYYCPKQGANTGITNSTFSNNLLPLNGVSRGGGIFLGVDSQSNAAAFMTAEFTNLTIADNRAARGAGIFGYVGINNEGMIPGRIDLTLDNSIVALNYSSDDIENDIEAEFVPAPNGPLDDRFLEAGSGYNLIGTLHATVAADLIGNPNPNGNQLEVTQTDLQLAPLADNGGNSHTRALMTNSIAIDAGDDSRAVVPFGGPALENDQRGPRRGSPFARFVDVVGVNDSQPDTVDIGAYEAPQGATTNLIEVTTLIDETTDNGQTSLREALILASNRPGHDTIKILDNIGNFMLPNSQFVIDSNAAIIGPGSDLLTIGMAWTDRAFSIINGATVEISGMTLSEGGFVQEGGLIRSEGNLTLRDIDLGGGNAVDGGGIFSVGVLDIYDSSIWYNTATNEGGGIRSFGSVSLTDTRVTNNTAQSSTVFSGYGGGLHVANGSLTMLRSTVDRNLANVDGGGIWLDGNGVSKIESSTISRNNTIYSGGGLYARDSDLDVLNTTIANNTSFFGGGGGVYLTAASNKTANFVHATVAFNSADTSAGGIHINSSMVDVYAYNSIVVDNYTLYGPSPDIAGSVSGGANNLLRTGSTGGLSPMSNQVLGAAENSLLASLALNGGPTETIGLKAGSMAINNGDDAFAQLYGIDKDQRGEDRTQGFDIGALEVVFGDSF